MSYISNFLHFVFNIEIENMWCAFRVSPLAACLWLIVTFGHTCFASDDVSTEQNQNQKVSNDEQNGPPCNLSMALNISEGIKYENKSIIFNETEYFVDEYYDNGDNHYYYCEEEYTANWRVKILSNSECLLIYLSAKYTERKRNSIINLFFIKLYY